MDGNWDSEDTMPIHEREHDNNSDSPPKAAQKLAEETGEPVEKFTPADDAEYPHPTELEKVEPSDVE